MRIWKSYQLTNEADFRKALLKFTKQFPHFIFLDSCSNPVYGQNKFRYLLAAGVFKKLELNAGDAFQQLKLFLHHHNDWCFGYFGYDLKNETEQLGSHHFDGIGFSDMTFFIPEVLVVVDDDVRIGLLSGDHDNLFDQIENYNAVHPEVTNQPVTLAARIPKADYLQKVESIRDHIIDGDIYEMNLCQEFFAGEVQIDPVHVFDELCNFSKAPFSCLFGWGNKYLISASPERFLKKSGNKLISQPIKGTAARSSDPVEDAIRRSQLAASIKDKAENVMIVDLVRNDLAKSCKPGSVKVDELFGIYSFEQVHQMVSVISGEIKEGLHPIDTIRNAFPMGSMTGAPKVMAMQLIEEYEETKRGLYAGSIGYFTPEGDFDLNVVIRSILYNGEKKYLSVQVGGAIVYDSNAEHEYEECLVKLKGIQQVLSGDFN